ncbi:MAG: hypothetical protein M1358_20240 [Chloroflexi bacterium]|nr:hypothetical protein [Chloroflexota bacterium]
MLPAPLTVPVRWHVGVMVTALRSPALKGCFAATDLNVADFPRLSRHKCAILSDVYRTMLA